MTRNGKKIIVGLVSKRPRNHAGWRTKSPMKSHLGTKHPLGAGALGWGVV